MEMKSSRKVEISFVLEDEMGSWCGNIFVVLRNPGLNDIDKPMILRGRQLRMGSEGRQGLVLTRRGYRSLCQWYYRDNSCRHVANLCRSQWPPSLRHETSSPAQSLGSSVWIPLEALMSVCLYSVCAVLYAGNGLVTSWSPSKESYDCVKDQETEKAAKAQQRAVVS
jgi:hypothetical protein